MVCTIEKEKLLSHVRVLDIVEKPKETFIENADVLVVAGRGVKKPEDLKMLENWQICWEVSLPAPVRWWKPDGWMPSARSV